MQYFLQQTPKKEQDPVLFSNEERHQQTVLREDYSAQLGTRGTGVENLYIYIYICFVGEWGKYVGSGMHVICMQFQEGT